MSAGQLNLTIEQGASFLKIFTVKDHEGTPIDLTGFSLRGQIRETYSASSVIASFSFEIHEPLAGKFKMKLTPAQTAAIPVETAVSYKKTPNRYAYDVELVTDTGEVERLVEGIASISPEVTL